MEQLILTGNLSSSDIPLRISEPFQTTPSDMSEIENRIREGGKLTLENAELKFGEINIHNDSKLFLGIQELELINSKIVTNGNFLEIFCKRISMDDSSKIISFTNEDLKAENETDGDYGGDVHIYVLNEVVNELKLNLRGQYGGNGLKGTTGATGREGRRGRSARNGSFGTCRRGPGRGHRGGQGGQGGNGTDAGDGGDGGILKVYYLEKNIPDDLDIDFKTKAGQGGQGGAPGDGGQGGRGGRGGSNAGNCTPRRDPERSRGPQGTQGNPGNPGNPGKDGSDGKSFIERIEIDDLSK